MVAADAQPPQHDSPRVPAERAPLASWKLLDPARTSPLFTISAVSLTFEREILPLLERASVCACCPRAEAAARRGESGSVLLPSFWTTAGVALVALAQSAEAAVQLQCLTTSVWLQQVSDGTVRDGCTPAILALQGRTGPADMVLTFFRFQAEAWTAGSHENLRRIERDVSGPRVDVAYQVRHTERDQMNDVKGYHAAHPTQQRRPPAE